MGVFSIGEALAMAGADDGGRPFGGGQARGRPRVRRGSLPKGLCEQGFWGAFDPRAGGRLMLAAERYDRRGRGRGRRNGPLGHIALELLRALIRRVDHRSGRLDPALTTLMADIGRSRGAIVAGLKALRTHGFLRWLRRYETVAGDGPGPRIRQASNAYRLSLPDGARHLLGRLIPPPWRHCETPVQTRATPTTALARALRRARNGAGPTRVYRAAGNRTESFIEWRDKAKEETGTRAFPNETTNLPTLANARSRRIGAWRGSIRTNVGNIRGFGRKTPDAVDSAGRCPQVVAMTQPARQPQNDLFLDSPLYGDVQGERTVAEFPFFSLAKSPQMEPMVFASEDVRIEISPSPIGIATIYDKEVLLYIASLMAEQMEKNLPVSHEISFTAHDFFRVTGANVSGKVLHQLKRALRRLQGTEILTNIETGGEGEEGGFSWLLDWNTSYARGANGEKRLKAVKVRLCDWLFRAILKDRRIAAYHLDFFRLGPIERRLYELAMFNCVGDRPFALDLERLALKVGCSSSERSLAKFKRQLRDIAEKERAAPNIASR